MQYRQTFERDGKTVSKSVQRVAPDNSEATIQLDLTNMDYLKFKEDMAAGVTLNDPNGNPMPQAAIQAFVATLP